MKMKITMVPGSRALVGFASLAVALAALTANFPVHAQRHHRAGAPRWHGDISRFHEHDWGTWHGGHWVHGRHDGRLAWWWVAGGLWYPYPTPVYPYPNPWEPPPAMWVMPPVSVVPPAPPTQYWYYCDASRTYYPYVATCPGGWKQVPATPADASTPRN